MKRFFVTTIIVFSTLVLSGCRGAKPAPEYFMVEKTIIEESDKKYNYLDLAVNSCKVRDKSGNVLGYYQKTFPKIYDYSIDGDLYKISDIGYIHKNCVKEKIDL